MWWHVDNRTTNGIIRHSTNSQLWKYYDRVYLYFACDTCNVRLGLAFDEFNPFRTLSITEYITYCSYGV